MENHDNYKSLRISTKNLTSRVFYLHLSNPRLRNALSLDFFSEFPRALSSLDQNPNCNVIVLSGDGEHFCSGIDLAALASVSNRTSGNREVLRREILSMQSAITALERSRKPVIAAIQGGCIGGGIDLVTACDIRFCTVDAFFSVKEVDLGITADLGTLQRLPAIVGHGNAVELALTGRRFSGREAKELGLVSTVFGSREEMNERVDAIAERIASKSPNAVMGTKAVLLRSKDLTLEQGLDYVATWNSAMLASDEIIQAVSAQAQNRKRINAKL